MIYAGARSTSSQVYMMRLDYLYFQVWTQEVTSSNYGDYFTKSTCLGEVVKKNKIKYIMLSDMFIVIVWW